MKKLVGIMMVGSLLVAVGCGPKAQQQQAAPQPAPAAPAPPPGAPPA